MGYILDTEGTRLRMDADEICATACVPAARHRAGRHGECHTILQGRLWQKHQNGNCSGSSSSFSGPLVITLSPVTNLETMFLVFSFPSLAVYVSIPTSA